MEYTAIQAFPSYIKPVVLQELLEEACARETLLQQIIRHLEQRHSCSLTELEDRLAQGEGQEHPDWEDSIEWRNAAETLQRTQFLRSLLEWLVNSLVPSLAS